MCVEQTVPSTMLIRYEGKEYSVPLKCIGKTVSVYPQNDTLYIYMNEELVAVHDIRSRKINYDPEHYRSGLQQQLHSKELHVDTIVKRNLELFSQNEEDDADKLNK